MVVTQQWSLQLRGKRLRRLRLFAEDELPGSELGSGRERDVCHQPHWTSLPVCRCLANASMSASSTSESASLGTIRSRKDRGALPLYRVQRSGPPTGASGFSCAAAHGVAHPAQTRAAANGAPCEASRGPWPHSWTDAVKAALRQGPYSNLPPCAFAQTGITTSCTSCTMAVSAGFLNAWSSKSDFSDPTSVACNRKYMRL